MNEKLPSTYFKQEVENIIKRYGNLTAYEIIGALEVIKANILDKLAKYTTQDE